MPAGAGEMPAAIVRDWAGYPSKAACVLECLERDCEGCLGGWDSTIPIPRDGDWFKLGRLYNVGRKLLVWMVENGLLERRYDHPGHGVESVLNDWYRAADPDPDLGDLWIE